MITEQAFKTIYDDFLESGLSVRSYCTNQGMSEAKFYYWQKKLRKEPSKRPCHLRKPPPIRIHQTGQWLDKAQVRRVFRNRVKQTHP